MTTATPVKFVKELTGGIFVNEEGASHNLYQAEDGTLLVSSYAPANEQYDEHTLAWVAVDESGQPDPGRMLELVLEGDDYPYVDGPANHEAALEQHGFVLESSTVNNQDGE